MAVSNLIARPLSKRVKNLTGQTFGRLTVIEYAGLSPDLKAVWRCRCACGKMHEAKAANLTSGGIRSCGCSAVYKLVGQRFGRLTALESVGKDGRGEYIWRCLCDCGTYTDVQAGHLRSGHTQSCGCLNREATGIRNTTHGLSARGNRHPLYDAWQGMIQRCVNPNQKAFKNYGGRGISVCERWRRSFADFLTDMGERPDGKTLERIDNDGPYSPDNCAWKTPKEQIRNRRTNPHIPNGHPLAIEEWLPVVGYEGLYEVSNMGRVRSLKRTVERQASTGSSTHRYPVAGKLLALRPDRTGFYRSVGLCKNGVQRQHLVHSLVLTAFCGPRPPGHVGCHGSLGSRNNTLPNLRWDTKSANARDPIFAS